MWRCSDVVTCRCGGVVMWLHVDVEVMYVEVL